MTVVTASSNDTEVEQSFLRITSKWNAWKDRLDNDYFVARNSVHFTVRFTLIFTELIDLLYGMFRYTGYEISKRNLIVSSFGKRKNKGWCEMNYSLMLCSWNVVGFVTMINVNHVLEIISDLKDNVIQLANSNFENVVPPSIIDDLKRKLLTVDDLRYFYFGNKPLSKETISNYSDYITDVIFCRPIHEVANIQMQLGHKSTYLYKFSYDNKASFLKIMFDITIPGTVIHWFQII